MHAEPKHAPHRDAVPVVQYANFCRVTGSPEELLLDFALLAQPASGGNDVVADRRVVMTPFTAKRMLGALGAAIRHYEQAFGTIETDARNRVRPTSTLPRVRPAGSRPRIEPIQSDDLALGGTTSDAVHVAVEPMAVSTA